MTVEADAVPLASASFDMKVAWLRKHRPETLRMAEERFDDVLRTLRPTPRRHCQPAMLINLSGQMEYRALDIHDPDVLLVPAANRLGRKMHDVLPSSIMDTVDRCIHRVHATGRPSTYMFPVRDVTYKGTIAAPSRDTYIISVARVV